VTSLDERKVGSIMYPAFSKRVIICSQNGNYTMLTDCSDELHEVGISTYHTPGTTIGSDLGVIGSFGNFCYHP
jgi:hypothetical protein